MTSGTAVASVPVARVATLPQTLALGQTFSVTLVGDGLSSVVSATVGTDGALVNPQIQSAAAVAAALAERINALAPADYTAVSDGATLVVVNRASHRFMTVPQAPATGQIFSVGLVGLNGVTSTVSHTTLANETAEQVATQLAQSINALSLADYAAIAEGATVKVFDRAGDRFTLADLFVIDTDQGAVQGTAAVTLLELEGAPVVGSTWAIRLGYGIESRTVAHTVAVGDDVEDIATALALGISTALGADFTAVADGAEIILVRRTAGGFNASFETQAAPFGDAAATTALVTLTGTPAAGETWKVTIGGVAFSVVANPGETVQAIAARLKTEINNDTTAEGALLVAEVEGATLVIANRASPPPSTSPACRARRWMRPRRPTRWSRSVRAWRAARPRRWSSSAARPCTP
jgi:phage tail sheath gpL-like